MPWDDLSNYVLLSPTTILADIVESLRDQLSDGDAIADVTDTSPFIQHAQAVVIAPFEQVTQDISFLLSQIFLDGVSGNNLDKWAEGFGYTRLQATRAEGTIDVVLESALSDASYSNPFLASGSIVFRDTAGNRYDLIEDVGLPADPTTTTALDLPVRARSAGAHGNVSVDGLSLSVEFVGPTSTQANTRWNAEVNSFTNEQAFTGGSDPESDTEFKQRIRQSRASRESASVPGLEFSLEDAQIGVDAVDVVRNQRMVGGDQNTGYSENGTGTGSQSIDGSTRDAIAFEIPPGSLDGRWYQHVRTVLASNADLVTDVQVETDAAGSPSGTRVAPNFRLEDLIMAAAGDTTSGTFPTALADYTIDEDTDPLWLVFYHESGSGTFEGDGGGTAGNVKVRATGGAWGNDANINRGNFALIGGVPPKSVRVYVLGGTDDDVAEVLFRSVAAGIQTDGATLVQVEDSQGFEHPIRFERPTEVPVYVDITVERTAGFPATGGADAVKDIMILYVGGTTVGGRSVSGDVGVAGELVYREIVARVMDDDNITGVHDISALTVGLTASPTGEINLQAGEGEIFRLTPDRINVTIVEA